MATVQDVKDRLAKLITEVGETLQVLKDLRDKIVELTVLVAENAEAKAALDEVVATLDTQITNLDNAQNPPTE